MFTVRNVIKWLSELPEEFQDANLENCDHGFPLGLKRIVAYRMKDDPTHIGVVVNSMGTHLPFDHSLKWEHTLS